MYKRTFAAFVVLLLSAVPSIAETMNSSWYGPGFNGRRTASGDIFNQNAMTAAHKTLPFGTRLKLTNSKNGKTACVTINDRGPYHGGRQLDVSKAAAVKLGFINSGTAKLSVVRGGC